MTYTLSMTFNLPYLIMLIHCTWLYQLYQLYFVQILLNYYDTLPALIKMDLKFKSST